MIIRFNVDRAWFCGEENATKPSCDMACHLVFDPSCRFARARSESFLSFDRAPQAVSPSGECSFSPARSAAAATTFLCNREWAPTASLTEAKNDKIVTAVLALHPKVALYLEVCIGAGVENLRQLSASRDYVAKPWRFSRRFRA